MDSPINIILSSIMCLSIFCLVFSYILFPIILKFLSKNKTANNIIYNHDDEWPHVSILMSLYNEEKIIIKKLESLQEQNYPSGKLDILIGSDCSSDNTNEFVQSFIENHRLNHFNFHPFTNRQGKPGVINTLAKKAKEKNGQHVFIITDASVILSSNTIRHLVKHFKNEKIGLVDAHMKHTHVEKGGIAQSEDSYISNEVHIKYRESLYSGKMMGPFGGCYALRSELFTPVPHNFLVDDFYLAMQVLSQNYNTINDLDAVCHESVSQSMQVEYRRKSRISAGNFQNLNTFKNLLLPHHGAIAFNFLSHKVLRWLGPFFILASLISNLILCFSGNLFLIILFNFQVSLIIVLPFLDWILFRFNIHIKGLRSIRYFFMMNLALLEGFFKYVKGIKSNVWQPTQRPD